MFLFDPFTQKFAIVLCGRWTSNHSPTVIMCNHTVYLNNLFSINWL